MWEHLYPVLDWSTWSADWPLSQHSRFVQTPDMRWHIQRLGQGPSVVLLHGTGASTHTWREVAPLLAQTHDVLCVDLPGHGFSSCLRQTSPTPRQVAKALQVLLQTLQVQPVSVIGHSAGATVAAAWWLDTQTAPQGVSLVAINPAWQSLPGAAQWLFPLGAWLLDLNPWSGWLLAKRARQSGVVKKLLQQTGSQLSDAAVALYQRLLQEPAHVRGVLQLMSAWQVHSIEQRLAQLRCPVLLHIGLSDATVPPSLAHAARALLPQAQFMPWSGLGHLLHEEQPQRWVDATRHWWQELGNAQ